MTHNRLAKPEVSSFPSPHYSSNVPCCVALALLLFQAPHHDPAPPGPALPERDSPQRPAVLLMRQGKVEEARNALQRLLKSGNTDAETWYQLSRTYLTDFYQQPDPAKRRISLSLAMEALATTLTRNPDHLYALKAKSVIHARAELLYYDPNLAYQLASRVVKLQPFANEFLLNLSEWMSGEVRFTEHSDHRVPHDPQLGLDRSLELIERVVDGAMPYSNEEAAGLFLMAKTLSRRGNYSDSLNYYRQALVRPLSPEQKMECLRELGASQYRLGDFNEAARNFYEVLQVNNNLVDQWLLFVALEQLGKNAPRLPSQYLFPDAPRPDPKGWLLDFQDIAPALGVNRFDGNGTCSWGDFDNDGDPDLFLAGSGTFLAVYRNDAGKFKEVTAEVGLAKQPSGYSLNLIDYDNDGKLDLYLALNGWSGPMKNRLFHNTGGRFEDVSAASGADDPGSGFISLWGDLDNDGLLDLAVANGVLKDGSLPQIYRNLGNGKFKNMTEAAGIREPHTHGAIGIALGDYDKDGDLDFLINGLNNSPNRLYRNDGNWRFTEVSRQAGLLQPLHNGFVCFFADFNNDGWPEILTTSLAPWEAVVDGMRAGFRPPSARAMHPDVLRLFQNNKDGTFTDITYQARLFYPMGAMGAGVADVDNDGCLDLYVGTGDPQLSRLEPNRLFRNNCDGSFTDVTSIVGFARPGNKGHGVSFIDIDNDGDLEIYAQLGGHYQGDHARNAFYQNRKANQHHWLEVDLKASKSNRFSVGAQLTLKSGAFLIYREVKGSEGFGATNPYRQHFGLGARTNIDSLEVKWPSGIKRTLKDLKPDQIVTIEEQHP